MTLWNLFCRSSGLTGVFPRSELFNSEAYGGWDRAAEREVGLFAVHEEGGVEAVERFPSLAPDHQEAANHDVDLAFGAITGRASLRASAVSRS